MTTEIQQQQDIQQNISAKSKGKFPKDTQLAIVRPKEEEYAGRLESALQTRTDIVVDFSCLKTCLDPLNETTDSQDEQV